MPRVEKLMNKNYLLLWAGLSVSQLGNGAGFIAVMWWVQVTTGSALALGTLAMVNTLVYICAGPFAGVVVDRVNRKTIIVGMDIGRGLIYCWLAYLVFADTLTLPVLMMFSAVASLCSTFFGPAVSASIPLLVPDKSLEKANSLNQVSANIVNIVGYAAGGMIVAFFGIPVLLFVNGLSFIISAISEIFITIPQITKGLDKVKLNASVFIDDIKIGYKYIREHVVLVKIIQVAMVLNFFTAPFFILLPKFVSEYMSAGSEVYGYILSVQMLGALVATLVITFTSFIRNNLWLVKWGLIFQGALYFTLPFLPGVYWGLHLVVFAILGCFNTVVNIYLSTMLQRVTEPAYMGKVFGLLGTMTGALQPLAQGATGLVADFIRLPIIFAVSGLATIAGGFKFILIPNIDNFLRAEQFHPKQSAVVAIDD